MEKKERKGKNEEEKGKDLIGKERKGKGKKRMWKRRAARVVCSPYCKYRSRSGVTIFVLSSLPSLVYYETGLDLYCSINFNHRLHVRKNKKMK